MAGMEQECAQTLDAVTSADRGCLLSQEVSMSEPRNTQRIRIGAPTAKKHGVFSIPCPRCGVPEGERCWFGVKTFALAHKERWQKFSLLPVREVRVPRSYKPHPPKEVVMHKNWKESIRAQCAKGAHWL